MTEFWILVMTHLGMFAFGIIVSKNLRRWFTLSFAKNPVQAIEIEIDKLKSLANSLRGRT